MTMQEQLGETRGKKFVLHWAWHPKPLPTAVPNSAAIAAAHLGMDVVIARPNGYDLDPADMGIIERLARSRGGSLAVTDDLDGAIEGASAVYPKSWGALENFGRPEEEGKFRAGLRDWKLTMDRVRATKHGKGRVLHCLPVRRNVEIDGAVLDSANSAEVDQAENRLHAQRALLLELIGKQ